VVQPCPKRTCMYTAGEGWRLQVWAELKGGKGWGPFDFYVRSRMKKGRSRICLKTPGAQGGPPQGDARGGASSWHSSPRENWQKDRQLSGSYRTGSIKPRNRKELKKKVASNTFCEVGQDFSTIWVENNPCHAENVQIKSKTVTVLWQKHSQKGRWRGGET